MTVPSIEQLLRAAHDQGIQLWLDEGQLRYKAPQGALTNTLRTELAQRKLEIIAFLRQTEQRASLPTLMLMPQARYEPFPLTDVQQAYWLGRGEFFELSTPSHSYVEIEGQGLDATRLGQAWQKLILRHEMLRAVILPSGEQQILAHTPPYVIETVDLRTADAATIADHVETVRRQMFGQSFPTSHWPLFALRFTLLPEQRLWIHFAVDMLIIDWSSYELLLREWAQLYANPHLDLPPLTLSFRDYVLAEKKLAETAFYQRSRAYWLERLTALPPAPELPLSINPISLASPQFKRYRQQVEPTQWNRIKAQANQVGLTPTSVLLTAFAQVLTVWSKRPQFTLNLTLFNRLPLAEEVEQIVGDFTMLTLLAVDHANPDESFIDRARRLQAQLWQDLDHRYFSGVQVLRELAAQQGAAGRALLPVVFTSGIGLTDKGANWFGEEVYGLSQTPQVWLDSQAEEQFGRLWLTWDVVEALFPLGLIEAMFEAYTTLVKRLAVDDTVWAATTVNLVPQSQLALRCATNATVAPLSNDLLHSGFLRQVQACANEPAIITPQRTLTYQDLYLHANRLGHWLRQQGVRPNTLVGVVMEKGWEQVVGVLGILMAGAAYLPIDPELPTERQHYLLSQGEVKLALTQAKFAHTLTWPAGIQPLAVDAPPAINDLLPLPTVQTPGDIAYVIYTSGSTGLPKGVVIDHRGAVNTVLDINRRFGVTANDRVLALSALNFDLSVYDIFGLLAVGGAVVLPDAELRRDPAHWIELMVRHRVTVWDTVPALMQMVVDYLEPNAKPPTPSLLQDGGGRRAGGHPVTAGLRLVMMSGDWIPVPLPDRIKALWPQADVYSLGGATEASIWSICYPIAQVDPTWPSIPYGKPLTNQTFHVLDAQLNPRPMWIPGDLYIGGIGLALGYWKDEAKTSEHFITHPRTGERLYKTGDLGRYLPDGDIEFLGREDSQVKIRGHRIELGEIETALLQHPSIREAVVNTVGDPKGNRQLVAYVVIKDIATHDLAPEASTPDAQVGVLLDPGERIAFKLIQPGLRCLDAPAIALPNPMPDDALRMDYLTRQSYRHYLDIPLVLEQFSAFLRCLAALPLESAPLPKYRYPSAGSLYPVQTYLYIKPGRVEGLGGGFYYYQPAAHQLLLLTTAAKALELFDGANQAIFNQAAFAIFLVGQMKAIAPMYGALARDFCLLEAGYMSQLLMTQAPQHQLGLCPIGVVETMALQTALALEEKHQVLHSLVGGAIDPVQTTRWQQMPQLAQAGNWQAQLRDHLRTKLPAYMLPAHFVQLDALPLSANGKVDRKALPLPDVTTTAQATVEPVGALEQTLARHLQELLGLETINVTSNLFDLGANSLHVVQLYNKLHPYFNGNLSVGELFMHPTIRSLGHYLSQKQPLSSAERTTQLLMHEPPSTQSSAAERITGEL
jgi:amino acid adenylation domain-containing protein